MRKILALLTVLALCLSSAAFAELSPGPDDWTTEITVHFATVEEGRQLMRERTAFHNQINEYALEFFLQRKGGTLEEYIDFSADQVRAFTPEEEERITEALGWLCGLLEEHHLRVPKLGPVIFVKTTCQEVSGASGYTSGGAVFINESKLSPDNYPEENFRLLIVHELSHCFSRNSREYREGLYSLVSFTIADHEFDLPEEVRSRFIANPDVEHHDNYATFTIGGEKKDCLLAFMSDAVFENPGDSFCTGMYTAVVALDGSGIYRVDEVDDFLEIVGRNTDYVEDPEELMATNVAFALTSLEKGYEEYKSPEILEKIIAFLSR